MFSRDVCNKTGNFEVSPGVGRFPACLSLGTDYSQQLPCFNRKGLEKYSTEKRPTSFPGSLILPPPRSLQGAVR